MLHQVCPEPAAAAGYTVAVAAGYTAAVGVETGAGVGRTVVAVADCTAPDCTAAAAAAAAAAVAAAVFGLPSAARMMAEPEWTGT